MMKIKYKINEFKNSPISQVRLKVIADVWNKGMATVAIFPLSWKSELLR